MKIPAHGSEYGETTHGPFTITVYALRENKRPIGFAPWPKEKKAKKRKRKEAAA